MLVTETPGDLEMHHFVRAFDIELKAAFPKNATAYRRFAFSDRSVGAVHSGWGLCELDSDGHVDRHVQSFEKASTCWPEIPR